jgi:hypothetical protein
MVLQMDSKAINKLIRSEVWPILREHGFSVFDSRSAFAYTGPFINVVSFQSFNSYLAGSLGCTTFSFTPRLGVYLIGSPREDRVKRDNAGRLRPFEYECSFRSELRKRTPVDGFTRDDVFYIDANGSTTAQCFQELRYLCAEIAPLWFKTNNDLESLLSRMQSAEEPGSAPFLDAAGRPGSYNWNVLRSVLLLVKHRQAPNHQSASAALESIERAMENILDFSTIQSGRPSEEQYAVEMRDLWEKLGDDRPVPASNNTISTAVSCLDGTAWADEGVKVSTVVGASGNPDGFSARKQLWPLLKSVGFSEFTDRLAHRVSGDLVEVVEFLPLDPAERRARDFPEHLFRIGIGVLWPMLGEDGLLRKNKAGEPRPTVNECHVSNWLVPEALVRRKARTAFESMDDAVAALSGVGFAWLDLLRNCASALGLFQRRDWELFWSYPMMRGYGASASSRRHVYIAYLSILLGKKSDYEEHIHHADSALHSWYPEHLQPRYEAWISQIKSRIRDLDHQAQVL